MKAIDLSAMKKALELVRAGRLQEATSCIQETLADGRSDPYAGHVDRKATVQDDGPLLREATASALTRNAEDLEFKPMSSNVSRAASTDLPDPPESSESSESSEVNSPSAYSSPMNEPSRVIESEWLTKMGPLAYRLFIPERNANVGLAPLVVMLHGCQQNARDFSAGTQMDNVAGKEGCFVVYPQQSNRANPAACWNWFKHNHQVRDKGEPQAIVDLVSHLVATYAIDASRIFIAGLSAGAAMAAILGEQYPEVFAAVGVHSGLPSGMASNLPDALQAMQGRGRPALKKNLSLPTIIFHGDKDATVAPVNGVHFAEALEHDADQPVLKLDGIMGRPFTRKIYRSSEGLVTGEYWVIQGASHAWSGGNTSGSYTDPLGPNASLEMIRFFLESTDSRG